VPLAALNVNMYTFPGVSEFGRNESCTVNVPLNGPITVGVRETPAVARFAKLEELQVAIDSVVEEITFPVITIFDDDETRAVGLIRDTSGRDATEKRSSVLVFFTCP